MELLLKSIAQIRRHVNTFLAIEDILLTIADKRSVHPREIIALIENAYGGTTATSKPCSVHVALIGFCVGICKKRKLSRVLYKTLDKV
jgi:hypothetical protein